MCGCVPVQEDDAAAVKEAKEAAMKDIAEKDPDALQVGVKSLAGPSPAKGC